jgi:hypothetical protein
MLSEVFAWLQHLPSWSGVVDNLAYPPTLAYGPEPPAKETTRTCKTSSGLVAVTGGGVYRGGGEEAS